HEWGRQIDGVGVCIGAAVVACTYLTIRSHAFGVFWVKICVPRSPYARSMARSRYSVLNQIALKARALGGAYRFCYAHYHFFVVRGCYLEPPSSTPPLTVVGRLTFLLCLGI